MARTLAPVGALRLLAFHHAGGSPSAFAGWQSALGPEIELVPVRLPGRGPDGRSRRYHDLTSLTEALAEELAPQLAEPHLMYGHSMGAAVAHRLARLRTARGQRTPDRLIVGAHPAPQLATAAARTAALSDAGLARWLADTSGLSGSLLDGSTLLDRLVTRLRADLQLLATGLPDRATGPVLNCPIDVFAGTHDPLVPLTHLPAWTACTRAPTSFQLIPGGHFFPRESKAHFFTTLRARLLPTAGPHAQAA